ncbi:hypothetical protein [Glaciihabitans sp. dw_435]|uniref:hypothetical protein n=1 Tax=Glaciihabitans sp. dw_435 TaxID=2720081 RepID=UPI001BD545B5|nr:hypothetical protein [Glaciihabitans sp. dw_435]
MTTDAPARTRQRIFPSTWAALVVSVVAAAGSWSLLTWLSGVMFTGGTGTEAVAYQIAVWVTPVLTIAGIVMNIAVGTNGGINRLVGVIGGLLLLSPLLVMAVVFSIGSLSG